MSFTAFKTLIDEISADIGPRFRRAVAEEAGEMLREHMGINRDGVYQDPFLYWTEATDKDIEQAAMSLKAFFSEKTAERIKGVITLHSAQVTVRPSAIWMAGKVYGVRLARMWSYSPGEGRDLRWAAEITAFGRVAAGGYRFASGTDRKKVETDAPSEHLAEKGMVDLFERFYRVSLLG